MGVEASIMLLLLCPCLISFVILFPYIGTSVKIVGGWKINYFSSVWLRVYVHSIEVLLAILDPSLSGNKKVVLWLDFILFYFTFLHFFIEFVYSVIGALSRLLPSSLTWMTSEGLFQVHLCPPRIHCTMATHVSPQLEMSPRTKNPHLCLLYLHP